MATILKRAGESSRLLGNFASPFRRSLVAPLSSTRAYHADTQIEQVYSDDERNLDDEFYYGGGDRARFGRPTTFFADEFYPLSQGRNWNQIRNMMSQINQSSNASRGNISGKGWTTTEDDKAVYLKANMPGLGKENVTVSVEDDMLVINGEAPKDAADKEEPMKYMSRIAISPEWIKIDEIKAEMKNGVLKVVLPKVKEEERVNVFKVTVN
ncbi:hypothetical protein ACHQM5_010634 [Ranunculus cassubicifolius]